MAEALGLIEVRGYLGAIAALDTALKAANVSHLQLEKIQGGFSTLQLSGDVAAVKAAVEASKGEAERLGCLLSVHVIARIDEQTEKLLKQERTLVSEIIADENQVTLPEAEEKLQVKQKPKKPRKEKANGKGGEKK